MNKLHQLQNLKNDRLQNMRNTINILFHLFVFCILPTIVNGQEIQVQAPQVVGVGEQYYVRFIVTDKTHGLQGPKTTNASPLGRPSQSSSTSISIINGHRETSQTTTFTYYFISKNVGTASFGAVTCTIDGKTISSKPFSIKVEKSSPRQQQSRQPQGGQDEWDDWGDPFAAMRQMQQQMQQMMGGNPNQSMQQGGRQSNPVAIDGSSLFARASVSNSKPYVGEEVIITYKVYTQVSLRQFLIDKLPGNKGFWAEDLTGNRQQVDQWEETVNGKKYMVAEIRRGALFAQEDGTLKIEPLDLDVLAMVPRKRSGTIWDLFNDPFFNMGQAVEKHLSTNAINVNVKSLPPSPESFCGGVGHFDIKSDIDNTNVKANEAITYRITISGRGNLMLINAPEPPFPSVFEVYDPEVKDDFTRSNSGVSGSRTFEWILIPRNQGEYEIPEWQISVFNPQTGNYETQTIPATTIDVEQADPRAAANNDDPSLSKKDIHYNKSIHSPLQSTNTLRIIDWWFWLAVVLIVLSAVATILVGRKREADMKDIAGMRLKRSTREARRRLKKAEKHLNDGEDTLFYEEVYKAIWGCLADKYNIELSKLSSETVKDCLEEKSVSEQQQQQILNTLTDVDMARFAPGDASTKKHEIYNEAVDMIASL